MSLTAAIKDLFSREGIAIIGKRQFVNVLDDEGAFKNEPPASKKGMKMLEIPLRLWMMQEWKRNLQCMFAVPLNVPMYIC